jgi:nucleotide-binding universal stress UspA family protein
MRILCPTDRSAGAAAALDKLLATFLGPGLTVDLLAVVDRRPAPDTTVVSGGESEVAGLLESERVRLERARTEVAMAVRTGHPAEEIVAFAAMRKPDLVILGSRPATGPGPGFSGSVASKVARYSPSSVLIARDGRPVGSVVLGYDASPDAETALSLLAELPFRSPAPDSRLYCVRGPSTPLIWDCTDPPGASLVVASRGTSGSQAGGRGTGQRCRRAAPRCRVGRHGTRGPRPGK